MAQGRPAGSVGTFERSGRSLEQLGAVTDFFAPLAAVFAVAAAGFAGAAVCAVPGSTAKAKADGRGKLKFFAAIRTT